MSVLLSRDFLSSIGVQLDDEIYTRLSNHYEHVLNEHVMVEIVSYLDDNQVAELETIKNADDETIRNWLVENVVELDEIIENEVATLLGEMAKHADEL